MPLTRFCVLLTSLLLLACSSDPAPLHTPKMPAPRDMQAAQDLPPQQDLTAPLDMLAPLDMAQDMAAPADMSPRILPELSTAEQAFELVSPFVGTGGIGFGYAALTPAAQAPLGLVKLGPDTTNRGTHAPIQHMSGYNFGDAHVRGFSHLHFVGTGVVDYGNLRVIPTRSLERIGPNITGSWWATQDREKERAEPGFYATSLLEPQVAVELTATPRAAAHRYTFDPATPGPVHIALDAGASVQGGDFDGLSVRVDAQGNLEGSLTYKGPYTGRRHPFTLHFVGRITPAPSRAQTWDSRGLVAGRLAAQDAAVAGVVLTWDEVPEPVQLRLGLSMVDQEAARQALEQEAPLTQTFEQLRAQTRSLWLEKLGRIRVAGGTLEERRIFYTALYNAYRMPTRLDAPDGRYPGLDGQIHASPGHAYYSDLSLWDSFRTTHPLYMLIDPQLQRDCLNSLLLMARDVGGVPRWPAAQSATGGMIGTSADMLFGDAASKGLDGIDWARAFEVLLATAEGRLPEGAAVSPRTAASRYNELGYIPRGEGHKEVVSRTLEFAYHDWGLSHVAARAGLMDEATRLRARSRSYANLHDPDTGFFRSRDALGNFPQEPLEPELHFDRGGPEYTEGSAHQWRFYVPHDARGLAALHGGPQPFKLILEDLFARSQWGETVFGRNVLPDSYYWHGNQPPLHSVYLFHAAHAPQRLTYWLARIRETFYDSSPAGLAGNDDGGTLSSWYIFSALGIYPIGGDDRYWLGAPIFTRAELDLSPDRTLLILAPEAAPGTRDVASVRSGDLPLTAGTLTHAQLISSPLTFQMRPHASSPAD